MFGDAEGVELVSELIYRHGWRPIVRGDLEVQQHDRTASPALRLLLHFLGESFFFGGFCDDNVHADAPCYL